MATSFAPPVRRRRSRLVLLATFVALVAPHAGHAASSYGWPLEPFDRQHPVRGFFGDPRIGEAADGHVESKTFHFGIDISAPDGTPVYATASGPIVWEPQRPETIAVRAADGRVFAYWHIIPAVRNGQYAVAARTILGHIAKGWGHVHLAELVDGRYVNPLRRGGLAPYRDTTRPTIHTFSFERGGKALGVSRLSGRFDLVAETWDDTPIAVPGKWGGKPVMPAVIRWRIRSRNGETPWQTAVDFSTTIPPPDRFDAVFAPWTRQNHAWRAGRYRVQLAHGWDSRGLPDGRHLLEVEAIDTRGNRARSSTTFSVSN
jgi:hypothetical protein